MENLFKDRDEFAKWADVLRKKGVKTLKIGEVSLEFTPEALLPESEYKKKKRDKETSELKEATPHLVGEAERALFWSASSLPEELSYGGSQ